MKHEDTRGGVKLVDEIDVRRIAADTLTDVRSVRKALQGGHVRGLAGARIQRALAERAKEGRTNGK